MYTMLFDVTSDRRISLRFFVKNEKHPTLIPGINEMIQFFNLLSINRSYSAFLPYENDSRGWELVWFFPMHLLFFFYERYHYDHDASTGPLGYYVGRLGQSLRNLTDIMLPIVDETVKDKLNECIQSSHTKHES